MAFEIISRFINSIADDDIVVFDPAEHRFLSDFIDALPKDVNIMDLREDDAVYHIRLERDGIEVCVPLVKNGDLEKALTVVNVTFSLYEASMR